MIPDPSAYAFCIKNTGVSNVTVMGSAIQAGSLFQVPSGQEVSFGKNAYLRILIETENCSIVIYGLEINDVSACLWLSDIASGEVVFS